MAIDVKKLRKQTDFCVDLMNRLNEDIKRDIDSEAWVGVYWHYRKRQDIIRLRRELNTLNKLLDPYGDYYNG